MAKYRKKPVVIDAFQWTGDQNQTEDPEWIVEAIHNDVVAFVSVGTPSCTMEIETLEGTMTANMGDYIIKGIKGEIYPCKPDIFEQSYDVVTEEEKMKEESPTFYNNSKYMD